jgi:hypothetical protein
MSACLVARQHLRGICSESPEFALSTGKLHQLESEYSPQSITFKIWHTTLQHFPHRFRVRETLRG